MLLQALRSRLFWLLVIALIIYVCFIFFGRPASPFRASPRISTTRAPRYPPIPSRLLPYYYWKHRSSHPDSYGDESCTRLAQENDIQYAAAHWQHLKVANGSVYAYSAFWDDRFDEPNVMVLVYSDVEPLPDIHCQLWYLNESAPQVVLSQPTYGWNKAWGGPEQGINEPYILACPATYHHHHPDAKDAPPFAVSLTSSPCERANNILNVQGAPMPHQPLAPLPADNATSVAVCLKWMDYHADISAQLVEWLQLLKYFKAQVVYIYLIRAHKNVRRVLEYYTKQGFVEVTELAHPPWLGGRPFGPIESLAPQWTRSARDFHDFRRELLPLNDCLYRSLRKYRWIASMDLDEIIVPVKDGSYPALLARELPQPVPDAMMCLNMYYLDEAQRTRAAPPFARMLAHQWRTKDASPFGFHVKSFQSSRSVLAMHNHMPRTCGIRRCHVHTPTADVARLQHYREKCDGQPGSKECIETIKNVVRDTSLEPYRDRLLADIPSILEQLGIPVPKTWPQE